MAETITRETIEELRSECLSLVLAAEALDTEALRAWVALLERQDAIGCFTDPTAWRDTAKGREVSLKLLRAVLAFKAAIRPGG